MSFGIDDYEKAIARMFDPQGNVIGTGFLVAPGYVMTCAHVVLQAIGIAKEDFAKYKGQPQEVVSLDFHVLATGVKIEAEVVAWETYRLDGGDVAVLKLRSPEPKGVKPIPLAVVNRSQVKDEDHGVYGFGKNSMGGRSDAYRPKATVAGGRFQLCKIGDVNDETIKPGFSGAPVWNEARSCVIGMVATAVVTKDEQQSTAYAIPTRLLQSVLVKIGFENLWITQMDCASEFNTLIREQLSDPSVLEAAIGASNTDRLAVRVTPDELLVEDSYSTHLVIAVFWRERNEKLLRVMPKLCYRDLKSNDILQEPLSQEDCPILLKKFPEFLKSLIDFTNRKLAIRFKDSIEPWTLTIELFIPVDLLCQPLSTWYGQDRELICDRSIVVGCSDRFDRDRLGEAANLHNELKAGWKRFKQQAPDTRSSNLRALSWLSSDIAHRETFGNYSAFRCYGHWLKADEKLLKNWIDLVKSGIPLALWMCEATLPQHEIVDILGDLVDCTRFEFLQRIRKTRDRLQKICDHDIGIFYEDLTYVPDVPLPPEVQFFGFPGL